MKTERLLVVAGYIFLVWGILDIVLKVSIYSLSELDFIWFCSITLFILAFGLIYKSDILLNSFLSMALLVQPIFVLDYVWIAFFNKPLNGLSLFVFQPGFRLLEFIDNTRHLLMIPIGFYAVFINSKENKKSYVFITLFIMALLVFSYMFTPKYANTNCVFEPCVNQFGISLSGFVYFIFFLIEMIILSLFINSLINIALKKSHKFRNKSAYKKLITFIFLLMLSFSFVVIYKSFSNYSKIPRYRCINENNCVGCDVNVKCNYVYGVGENQTLIYTISNKGVSEYVCSTYIVIGKDKDYKKIAENSWIKSNEKYKIGYKLPYPETDSDIKLKLDCDVYN